MVVRRETTSLNLAKLRGVTFVNQYVVIKYLGKGANGRVFLCLDMCDNRLYAVKVGAQPLARECAQCDKTMPPTYSVTGGMITLIMREMAHCANNSHAALAN